MSFAQHPGLKWTVRGVGVVAAIMVVVVGGGYAWMKVGLARVDGIVALPGLGADVSVARDALGIPTIKAKSRVDAARALGFLHAQDRFFQMDLMRRRAAGELAELFGKAALPSDKEIRIHEFRKQAETILAGLKPEDRGLLEAYAAGVNAGLADLHARPFEYLVLRSAPAAWKPEDALLVGYAMVLDLGDATGRYKRTLAALTSAYGFVGLDFFAPDRTPTDAALDGSVGPRAAMPNDSVIDLHTRPDTASATPVAARALAYDPEADRIDLGSNSMAIAGAHTGGPALVANDMHLNLGVPNTWYRAVVQWPGHSLAGTTLPGVPFVVAGSNGQVAWGWTVGYADMGDLIAINTELTADMYYGPEHKALIRLETRKSEIKVKGSDPVSVDYTWSVWGPIVHDDGKTHLLAYHWVYDLPGNLDLNLQKLEIAQSVDEAIAITKQSALPCLNLVAGDAQGHIGWTVAGAIPKRVGFSGRTPVAFQYSDRRWDGVIPDAERPSITDPADGVLWTANARPVGGPGYAALGDGGYARPARAAQLRDDLRALAAQGQPVTPKDLLNVQLDDRALFLEPWRSILLAALAKAPEAGSPDRQALTDMVTNHWEAKADVGSVSYRLVRAFRLAVAHRVMDPIFEKPVSREDVADWTRINYEDALRRILSERPVHFLPSQYGSWDDLLLKAADDVTADLRQQHLAPAEATWGKRNTLAINHPFGLVMPHWLVGWLAMPAEPVPGDADMPAVAGPAYGASERFAVSPGQEDQGIFEMPGGESANPVSPYYRAGHEAWVHGAPSPFLPGPAEHTLVLTAR